MKLNTMHLEYIKSQYKGEITFRDKYLGRILERLDESQLANETIVIFVSDHGESFMENGMMGHGLSLDDTLLRVPFLICLPGKLSQGKRVFSNVELTDLAPTVFDMLGIVKPEGMIGRSLLPLMMGPDETPRSRATFASHISPTLRDKDGFIRDEDGITKHSVRYDNWKLVRTKHRSVPHPNWTQHHLFNTENDPEEHINLWPSKPIVGYTLGQMLQRQLNLDRASSEGKTSPPEGSPDDIDPLIRSKIEALGYLAH